MAQIKLNATYGLTGTLPALNGSALTNLDATDLSGNLPALNASALTTINASNISSGTLNTSRYVDNAGGASGTMILSEKYYDEVTTITANSTTHSSGNTVSFAKAESSSDSFIVYNWNGYIAEYANAGSDSDYRLKYTPSGGSATYCTNQTFIDKHTGEYRQYFPVSLNYTITNLNAGTHAFVFQCAHNAGNGANNNTQYVTDAHHQIIIREVLK